MLLWVGAPVPFLLLTQGPFVDVATGGAVGLRSHLKGGGGGEKAESS